MLIADCTHAKSDCLQLTTLNLVKDRSTKGLKRLNTFAILSSCLRVVVAIIAEPLKHWTKHSITCRNSRIIRTTVDSVLLENKIQL